MYNKHDWSFLLEVLPELEEFRDCDYPLSDRQLFKATLILNDWFASVDSSLTVIGIYLQGREGVVVTSYEFTKPVIGSDGPFDSEAVSKANLDVNHEFVRRELKK